LNEYFDKIKWFSLLIYIIYYLIIVIRWYILSQVCLMNDPTKRCFWLHTSHSIKPCMVNEWPTKKDSGFIHRTLLSQVWSMSDLTKRRFWLHTSHSIKPSMVDEWPHQKTILASCLTLHEAKFFCYDVCMKKYSKFKNFHNIYILYNFFSKIFLTYIYTLKLFINGIEWIFWQN
jgi:hypothetical protein